MKPASTIVGFVTLAIAASACQQAAASTAEAAVAAAPITEAGAAKIADETVANWLSKDAARIKAMYAADVAAFDVMTPTMFADRPGWDKAQDEFATLGMDGATQRERKIQILSPDVFAMSGTWDVTNSAHPEHNAALRCTVVYKRDTRGKWPITTEQCSLVPKPA